jgi:hypothetical protein
VVRLRAAELFVLQFELKLVRAQFANQALG